MTAVAISVTTATAAYVVSASKVVSSAGVSQGLSKTPGISPSQLLQNLEHREKTWSHEVKRIDRNTLGIAATSPCRYYGIVLPILGNPSNGRM